MMMTALFVALALATLVAGAVAVASQRGPAALAALAALVAGLMLFYEAPALAIVALAAIAGAALVLRVAAGEALAEAPGSTVPAVGAARRLAIVGVLAGLAFVMVGTWARQFVWTGRELAPGAGFGEMPAVAAALAGAPGLLGIGVVIVVAAAACAGPPRHRI